MQDFPPPIDYVDYHRRSVHINDIARLMAAPVHQVQDVLKPYLDPGGYIPRHRLWYIMMGGMEANILLKLEPLIERWEALHARQRRIVGPHLRKRVWKR